MSDTNVFFPTGKDVEINGQRFNIQPFVVKNRIKFLRVLSEVLLDVIKSAPGLNQNNFMGYIPQIIEVSGERLIDLYCVVLSKDREWIENNVQIVHEVDIINAIVEVNQIPLLWGRISNLIPRTTSLGI